MNKFAIGIATINQKDLLVEAINKYLVDFPNIHIYIVDNGHQDIQYTDARITIHISEKNLGVSDSWNLLCNYAFYSKNPVENILILNDDIYLGKKEDEVLSEFEEFFDFYVSHASWCSFLLSKNTFEKTGEFDNQFFPAYFEDNDYHIRMKLLGMSYKVTEKLTPEIFRSSCTIKKDPSLNFNFDLNRQKYINKWGGIPGQETFKTPIFQK